MSLEDRIRSTVDQAIAPLVKQLVDEATADRDAVVEAAKTLIQQQAEQASQARVAGAEARVRAELDQKIEQARAEDRAVAERDIRQKLEAEVEKRLLDAAAAAEQRLRTAVAATDTKAAEELKAAVSAARIKEREIEMAGVSRLLESIRGLDGATSLSEVLDALALAAAREAARAAVVVLRNDRIQGWRLSGFGSRDSQPKSIDLTLAESGVIGQAISVSRAVATGDSQSTSGPGFETLPADHTGLAVPVIVSGRAVAVVYADSVTLEGQNRQVPSSWPELIEILARHAGRCLEALASQKAAPRANPPAGNAAASNMASSSGK